MANVLQINQVNPLALVQQRFSLINLSADIRIVDNQEVNDVLAGLKSDVDFPYFSRHLIMSKMKRRGLYETHQIYGRI